MTLDVQLNSSDILNIWRCLNRSLTEQKRLLKELVKSGDVGRTKRYIAAVRETRRKLDRLKSAALAAEITMRGQVSVERLRFSPRKQMKKTDAA